MIPITKTHPDLVKQWHPTKNTIKPSEILAGSNKKVWWKCPKGDDHVWKASPNQRLDKNKVRACPICTKRIIIKSNSLATTHPDIAKEWDYEKNSPLTPCQIPSGRNTKYFWKCKNGHSYPASPNARTIKKTGCPVCSGNIVSCQNSLKARRPDLAKEWHPSKNGEKTPENTTIRSHKEIWWQCKKNPNHIWPATPSNRSRKSGGDCPICSNRLLAPDGSNSLLNVYPELAELWHPTKNGSLTPDKVVAGGETVYSWKCPKGSDHEWPSSIHRIRRNMKRHSGTGCPVCRGLKVVKSNCLATTHPKIVKYWDYEKNEELTPYKVTAYSNKQVFWKCHIIPRHQWKGTVNNRTNSSIGCKYCHKIIQKSFEERVLLFELKDIWPSIAEEGAYITRTKKKTYAPKWDIDIYIPELKIAIEYDGAYYHMKGQKRKTDKEKTEDLESQGITVIHVMQAPLLPFNENIDVVFRKFHGKTLTNQTLMKVVMLKKELIHKTDLRKIYAYINQNDLCNEEVREDFWEAFTTKLMREREERKYLNKISYLDYEQARDFARSVKFTSQTEWKMYAAGQIPNFPGKPKDVPSDPYSLYKGKGWKDWGDWLGIEKEQWRNFEKAKAFVHSLRLKNTMEWRQYIYGQLDIKKPNDIPNCPDKVYKNTGWKNMKDWLGTAKET
ncbi:MAG: zinc-ribbon domain-containing protein [Bacteroidales bacterium]|nr:zinc-ribbon domain-containing protein [Bacteroidales bacterium]